jgi:hypothetical protein
MNSPSTTDIRELLADAGLNAKRAKEYARFLASDVAATEGLDEQSLLAAICDLENLPQGVDPRMDDQHQEESVAAWAFVQISSPSPKTHLDFMAAVQALMPDIAHDETGAILLREPVSQLSRGLSTLASGLEALRADSILSRSSEAIGDLLDEMIERSEYDDNIPEQAVVLENTLCDWIAEQIPDISAYAATMCTFPNLPDKDAKKLSKATIDIAEGLEAFLRDFD